MAKRRCSEEKPACASCVRAGRSCEYDTDSLFRFSSFDGGEKESEVAEDQKPLEPEKPPVLKAHSKKRSRDGIFINQEIKKDDDTPSPQRKRARTTKNDRVDSSTADPSGAKPVSAKPIDHVVSNTRSDVQKQEPS